jgi:hypothetical protein
MKPHPWRAATTTEGFQHTENGMLSDLTVATPPEAVR